MYKSEAYSTCTLPFYTLNTATAHRKLRMAFQSHSKNTVQVHLIQGLLESLHSSQALLNLADLVETCA